MKTKITVTKESLLINHVNKRKIKGQAFAKK